MSQWGPTSTEHVVMPREMAPPERGPGRLDVVADADRIAAMRGRAAAVQAREAAAAQARSDERATLAGKLLDAYKAGRDTRDRPDPPPPAQRIPLDGIVLTADDYGERPVVGIGDARWAGDVLRRYGL